VNEVRTPVRASFDFRELCSVIVKSLVTLSFLACLAEEANRFLFEIEINDRSSVFRCESKDRSDRTMTGFYLLGTDAFGGAHMREVIRFAWGTSSLGDFVAAMSDKGLVAVEFSSQHSQTEDALRGRFPDVDVIDGRQGCSDVIERVARAIEEPGFDPLFRLICAARRMRSRSGRCCAQYPWAKRRATALWRPNWALATRET
jgi:hypothetical protein